jgi:hypothetical protein
VNEHSTFTEHAGDLRERSLGSADVKARAEVDDHVEGAVGKRHLAHVTAAKFRGDPAGAQVPLGRRELARINIETRKTARLTQLGEHGQGDPAPAADFEHPLATGQAQQPNQRRHLESLLNAVAPLRVRELAVGLRLPRSPSSRSRSHRTPLLTAG